MFRCVAVLHPRYPSSETTFDILSCQLFRQLCVIVHIQLFKPFTETHFHPYTLSESFRFLSGWFLMCLVLGFAFECAVNFGAIETEESVDISLLRVLVIPL